jgi:hypothetical protein
MEDKLFCIRCHLRIWRHADGQRYVDQYFQDQHFNCAVALGNRPPNSKNGGPDISYREFESDAYAKGMSTPVF